ncbi:hypothetical protein B0H19DRAFT_1058989 [Mycena capillaripes]|nr:hypothetical protein B0H19DRAFT_1058989 [Mycena capillaripes]
MSLSVEETFPWVYPTVYHPDLLADRRRMHAWAKANEATIREAMTVLIAARPARFPPGVSIDPTGSIFMECRPGEFPIPIYCNPTTIWHEHQEFLYTVSTPEHVAALHTIPDKAAVLAYI